MHSRWRRSTLGVALALGVVLGADIANLSAQASDPRIGTWKLNAAKPKYRHGPAPQNLTVKAGPSGGGAPGGRWGLRERGCACTAHSLGPPAQHAAVPASR